MMLEKDRPEVPGQVLLIPPAGPEGQK